MLPVRNSLVGGAKTTAGMWKISRRECRSAVYAVSRMGYVAIQQHLQVRVKLCVGVPTFLELLSSCDFRRIGSGEESSYLLGKPTQGTLKVCIPVLL